MTRTIIASPERLGLGTSKIKFVFAYDGGGLGKGGTGTLFINDRKVASGRIPKTEPVKFSVDETFDVGEDTGAPVGTYEAPFPFTGTLKQVDVDTAPQNLTDLDQTTLESMKKDFNESQE